MWRGLVLLLLAVGTAFFGCRRGEEKGSPVGMSRDAAVGTSRDAAVAPVAWVDVTSYRERARVPAIAWAMVTRDGEESGAVGFADIERRQNATADTAFEAASIAKTVIATCVMQLVEEGKLTLDAPLSAYLGVEGPRVSSAITLRHLLSHTSSIVDAPERTSAGAAVPLDDFLRRYFDEKRAARFLDAGPGTTMRYSNVGPSLAALVVERVSGARFAKHARTRVFAPLRMHATWYRGDTQSPELPTATPYAETPSGFAPLPPPSHALYPVVDLYASARDLGRFARAILRGGELDGARILSARSVDEMLRVQLPDAAPNDGLGWQARRFGTARVFGHEGEDSGASTALYVDIASGSGAVVLTNGDAFQGDDSKRTEALGELVTALLDPRARR